MLRKIDDRHGERARRGIVVAENAVGHVNGQRCVFGDRVLVRVGGDRPQDGQRHVARRDVSGLVGDVQLVVVGAGLAGRRSPGDLAGRSVYGHSAGSALERINDFAFFRTVGVERIRGVDLGDFRDLVGQSGRRRRVDRDLKCFRRFAGTTERLDRRDVSQSVAERVRAVRRDRHLVGRGRCAADKRAVGEKLHFRADGHSADQELQHGRLVCVVLPGEIVIIRGSGIGGGQKIDTAGRGQILAEVDVGRRAPDCHLVAVETGGKRFDVTGIQLGTHPVAAGRHLETVRTVRIRDRPGLPGVVGSVVVGIQVDSHAGQRIFAVVVRSVAVLVEKLLAGDLALAGDALNDDELVARTQRQAGVKTRVACADRGIDGGSCRDRQIGDRVGGRHVENLTEDGETAVLIVEV